MDSARIVLRKICADPEARKKSLSCIKSEHFISKKQAFIFKVICSIDKGQIISMEMLLDIVQKKLPEKHFMVVSEELGAIFGAKLSLDGEFEYALSALAQEAQTQYLCWGLQRAANRLGEGKIEEAKRLMQDISSRSDSLSIKSERRISARTMGDLKPDVRGARYDSGFKVVDSITAGGRRGELWLWAAYAAEFKSTALMAIAHHAFLHGKNVLFVSLEMDEDEIRRRLICQHARFLNRNLSYRNVELGTFSKEEKRTYQLVADDFDTNSTYGDIQIWQPPLGVTIMDVGRELERCSSEVDCEVLVLDYIQLLLPVTKRTHKRDEYNETLVRAKKIAMEARGREGVWFVSGYQTSQEGRKRAEQQGFYDRWSLSETIAAIQQANVVCWSLYTEKMQHEKEVKVGIMKSRNSSIAGSQHYLAIDPSVGFISKDPVQKVADSTEEASEVVALDEVLGL